MNNIKNKEVGAFPLKLATVTQHAEDGSVTAIATQGEYGYQFWLNAGALGHPDNRRFPELPADMFYADGYEGQFVFVVP